jgi:N-acetylmuramoyl-L-alanine amidase
MTILLALVLAAATPALDVDDEPDPSIVEPPTSSAEFVSSRDDALRRLKQARFEKQLASPGLGAMSTEDFGKRVTNINAMGPIAGLGRGDAGVKYDVILQPGHYGRKTGATGAPGKLVSEREFVAFVTAGVADALRAKSYSVLVVDARGGRSDDAATPEWDGLAARAFLAVHADGSTKPCTTGPSLGYAEGTSPYAMHAIGWAVSKALGYRYKDFRPDGFTANESRYYMFRRVRADEMTGLLEVGEITCEPAEKTLIESADRLATNVANAIDFVLKQERQ